MKSYLKFLSRNKLYTAVEAAGFILSLAFVLLIGNYVWQQYALARENPDGKRIYTVFTDQHVGMSWWDKDSFEEQLPEVEAACRLSTSTDETFRIGDTPVLAYLRYADATLFELLPYLELTAGTPADFAVRGSCLISQSFARAHFDGDPVGRELTYVDLYSSDHLTLTVSGIYRDFDETLLGRTDLLLNAAYDRIAEARPFSTRGQYLTLLRVPAGTDRQELTGKIVRICEENYSNWRQKSGSYEVVRFDELCFFEGQYFVRSANPAVLRMLAVVVLLLLLSAVFNYVNLNTALSGRRAKEMAMRRLLGSQRPAIFAKYIGESVLFALVCTALALLTAAAFRPMVESLLLNITVEELENGWNFAPLRIDLSAGALTLYALGAVLVGTAVGLPSAVMALRYAPIDVVRGTFRRHTRMLFSKVFIVIQHTLSVALIALSLVMELQMHHLLTRPLHSRTDGLYRLQFSIRTYDDVRTLVDRLLQLPGVSRVGLGNGYPSSIPMSAFFNPCNDAERSAEASFILCDEIYFDLLGLETVTDYRTPRTNSVWISESLLRELALADSLQQLPPRNLGINGARPEAYGGVYRDFPTTDAARQGLQPAHSLAIIGDRDQIFYANGLLIEVTGDRRATAEAIHDAYVQYSIEHNGLYNAPHEEGYLADVIAGQLRPFKMAMRLVELFMLLSLLLSLLGLVAMSTYFAGENTRSIAIRKIFGSDVRRELWRTVRGYMLLVAAAVAIGLPAAVWAAGRYLEQFAYRIEGYGWLFPVAALFSVAIAFGSVLGQTLRAARTNPANELKKE